MRQRYTRVAVALHWVMALIIIGNLAGGLLLDTVRASSDPEAKALARTVIGIHKALGISVLALILVRIGWRLGHSPPPLPAHMTRWERRLSGVVHFGFYALMLALPLTGWAMNSARVNPGAVSMFGLFDVAPLPVPGAFRGVFGQGHELLGWVMVAMLALHVLAVVKHQVLDRDDLIGRMLPGRP